jgi:hypothetical protein
LSAPFAVRLVSVLDFFPEAALGAISRRHTVVGALVVAVPKERRKIMSMKFVHRDAFR